MSNGLLKELQAIAHEFTLQAFDVMVVAFGQVFEGTVISHQRFRALLDASAANSFPPATGNEWSYHEIMEARKKLRDAIIESTEEASGATLYLMDVRIQGGADDKNHVLAIPIEDIKTWSLIGGRKLTAFD